MKMIINNTNNASESSFLGSFYKFQNASKAEKPTHATIWIAKTYPPWQTLVLTKLKALYEVCNFEIQNIMKNFLQGCFQISS